MIRGTIGVHSENYAKRVNTLCGKNEEFIIVTAGGTNIYLRPLKFSRIYRICLAYGIVGCTVGIICVL